MIEIAELRRLLAEATSGPWHVDDYGNVRAAPDPNEPDERLVGHPPLIADMAGTAALSEGGGCDDNANMIAALRNAAPELLDRLEAAERNYGPSPLEPLLRAAREIDITRRERDEWKHEAERNGLYELRYVEELDEIKLIVGDPGRGPSEDAPRTLVDQCRVVARERDEARALLARCALVMEANLRTGDHHYAHFDRTGGAGAGCPACHARSQANHELRALLSDLRAAGVEVPP